MTHLLLPCRVEEEGYSPPCTFDDAMHDHMACIFCCVSPIMFLPSCSKDFFFIPPTHILSLWAVCHITFICTYCGFTLPVLHAVKISKSHAHSTLLKFLSHSPLNFSYFNFQTWFLCWKVVSPQYFLIVSVSILCDQINLHLQETK